MHLHGYSSAFPRIRTNHHYMAQPDDFGPRRAHGAFGLFRLTRIYLSTYLPAYPLHYPLYCVSVLLPSVVVSQSHRSSSPRNCPAELPRIQRSIRCSLSSAPLPAHTRTRSGRWPLAHAARAMAKTKKAGATYPAQRGRFAAAE